ncbi:FAD-binding oxidoreductase [Hyphomicrobiales bacterium]|nr:FAD-binding oxidoreductase [Hyphomicrobiales bacterium]
MQTNHSRRVRQVLTAPIAVVGGGAVGVCIASELQLAGYPVVLLERGEIGSGCSSGNSGLISMTGLVPHAAPGVLTKLPRYLVDKNGPLTIRGTHFLQTLPWFRELLKASSAREYERIASVLAALLDRAHPQMMALIARCNCGELVRSTGTITLHETASTYHRSLAENELRRRHGREVIDLTGKELTDLEPAISPHIYRASLMPQNAFTTNPLRLVQSIADDFRAKGGVVMRTEVTRVEPSQQGMSLRLSDGKTLNAQTVVLSAGAWTKSLLAPLGIKLMLEPHRGYHVMAHNPGITLNHPLMWAERGFAIVPMEHGIRAAGKVEIADIDAPPDPRVPSRILEEMRSVFRSLDTSTTSHWMGSRPATPDSLPFIGPVPGQPDIIVATGHGHLGLSMSALTGRLVTEIIAGHTPSVDLAPLAVERFATRRIVSFKEIADV